MSISADFDIDALEVMKAEEPTNILSQLFLNYRHCEERTAVVVFLYILVVTVRLRALVY